jgi:hypothetical protein
MDGGVITVWVTMALMAFLLRLLDLDKPARKSYARKEPPEETIAEIRRMLLN